LAIVLQQLIDVSPLPALLMRTIIQTVHKYPKLTGFVMGLLARLITKQATAPRPLPPPPLRPPPAPFSAFSHAGGVGAQVWTDERLWQGWIKCCRSTTPHSYAVVLQVCPCPAFHYSLSYCFCFPSIHR
jgi:symplekin